MIAHRTAVTTNRIFNATVIVAALGYLVDIYDILIFNITRVASLTDLGLSGEALTEKGLFILNMQMLGLIIGGLFFGILGDKIGRKKSLLGSIFLYSTATLLCAFITDTNQYALLRFIAGIGLAGEIGVGVTMVCEAMDKDKRGWGVTLFSFIGISGAIIAAIVAETTSWRTAYIVGGVAGFALLFMRGLLFEADMFEKSKQDSSIQRGNLLTILKSPSLLRKYLACVALGAPIFYVVGLIFTLSPEIGKALNITTPINAPFTIALGYAALMFGDALAGALSQIFKTRKKIIYGFMLSCGILISLLLTQQDISAFTFYVFIVLLGLSIGYWVNLILLSSEQFGTNIRATAATSIPNFARATLLGANLLFAGLKPDMGVLSALLITGMATIIIGLCATFLLEETHGKDLDYHD